jgi:hypothetical protein
VLALASLWLLSPFATGALLGCSRRARRLAGRYYPALITLGVTGLLLVVLGAFVLPRTLSLVALGLGGPLSGLSFWARRTDGGDDGPGDDDEGDDDHGDRSGSSHGDDEGDDDENEDEDEAGCDASALVTGAVVKEAELKATAAGLIFREIELIS